MVKNVAAATSVMDTLYSSVLGAHDAEVAAVIGTDAALVSMLVGAYRTVKIDKVWTADDMAAHGKTFLAANPSMPKGWVLADAARTGYGVRAGGILSQPVGDGVGMSARDFLLRVRDWQGVLGGKSPKVATVGAFDAQVAAGVRVGETQDKIVARLVAAVERAVAVEKDAAPKTDAAPADAPKTDAPKTDAPADAPAASTAPVDGAATVAAILTAEGSAPVVGEAPVLSFADAISHAIGVLDEGYGPQDEDHAAMTMLFAAWQAATAAAPVAA